jgi:6-phosphogluconolactonase (cycloisomerase 2 family)/HSP20 family molecular chaperone IbpA
VTNHDSNDISGFAIDASTGTMTPVPGSPFATETGPVAVAVTPDAKHLYVASGTSSAISQYRIASDGELDSIGSPVAVGGRPTKLAIDPSGRYLFSTNREDGSFSTFSIDSQSGELHPLKNSPIATGGSPWAIAVSRDGRFVYIGDSSAGTVSVYSIRESSDVLQQIAGSPFPIDLPADTLAISASGKHLYVGSSVAQSVAVYALDALTGSLSRDPLSRLGGVAAPGDIAAAADGNSVFLGGSMRQSLSRAAVEPKTGELTLAAQDEDVPPGSLLLATEPTGRFLFAVSPEADSVTRYLVDATHAPDPESGIVYSTGSAPSSIAIASAATPLATGAISVSLTSSSLLTYSGTTGNVHITPAATNTGGSACAGQVIQLAFSVPSIAVISTASENPATSVCILTGQSDAAFSVTTAKNSGSATLTGFATGYTNGTVSVSVSLRQLTMSLPFTSIAVGHVVPGTLTLANPAPSGGVTVALATNAAGTATISPASVSIAAGSTTASFNVTGVAVNNATLSASVAAGGYGTSSIGVTVLPAGKAINLPHNLTVAPGQSLPYPVSIGAAAASNVSIAFATSGGPGTATISPNPVIIPAGQTAPTTQPTIKGGTLGALNVTGSASGYASDIQSVNVSITLTLSPSSQSVQIGHTSTLTLSASSIAPTGGFVIATAIDDTSKATVPATVTIPAGSSTATVTITGVAAGSTTLHATAAGAVAASAAITVNSTPGIALIAYTSGSPSFSVGKNGLASLYGNVAVAAPAGNLNVTLTSSSASRLLLSATPGGAGASSISVQVAAGSTSIPTFYAQALSDTGTATITATATGYSSGAATASFVPSGFIVQSNTSTTTYAAPSPVYVTFAQLDPSTKNYTTSLTLRAGAPAVTVALKNSNAAVGTLAASSIIFNPGDSQKQTTFSPLATGAATISFNGTPSGYSAAANYNTAVYTVTTPNSGFSACYGQAYTTYTISLGKNAQACAFAPLLAAPAPNGGRIVTLTSSSSSKVLLSTSATAVGAPSITVTVPAGSQYGAYFYVQALSNSGTVTVTETVSGYNPSTLTVNLEPSGFIIQGTAAINSFSSPSPVYVTFAQLDPSTLAYTGSLALRPGASPVTVPLKNSNTAVGTLAASSIVFNPGDSQKQTTFAPTGTAAGSATITVNGTPSGYSAPSNYTSAVFTVTAPNSGFSSCYGQAYTTYAVTFGKNAQSCAFAPLLANAAPSGGRVVTLKSSDSTKVVISTSATAVGTGTITSNVSAGSQYGSSFYIQALSFQGTVTITETVPGFNPSTLTVTLTKSGFIVQGTTSTTTFSTPSPVYVTFAQLDPNTLAYTASISLRAGATPVTVPLQNSNTAVGTLGSSSIVFHPGDSQNQTTFAPTGTAAGTSTITASTPANYWGPSNYNSAIFTVTAPSSGFSSCYGSAYSTYTTSLGKNGQSCAFSPLLGAPAPTGGRVVTITSGNSSKLLLSTSATAAGHTSITITVPAGQQYGAAFYLQALSNSGTVTITETTPGYNPATLTATLAPSGFILQGTTSTTTFAAPSAVYVTFAQLDPTTLNYAQTLTVRPGLATTNVGLANDKTTVGTLGATPLAFNPGDSQHQTTFTPIATGTATITFSGTPSGFSTPSNYKSAVYTVTSPNTGFSSCFGSAYNTYTTTLGKNAQSCAFAPLLAAPAPSGGRTVTLKSSNASTLLVSTTATGVGAGTISVPVAAGSQYGPSFYLQALANSGTATVTLTTPGYNSSTLTVTFEPSGFIVQSNTTTTTFSSASPVYVTFSQLDPGTSNYVTTLTLRPGAPAVSVGLSNSNTAVGTLGSNSIVFNPGASQLQTTFTPTGTASGVATIGFSSTPSGYSTPGNYATAVYTVTAPATSVVATTIGKNLQTTTYGYLAQPVPAGGRTVTVTSSDTTKFLLSATGTSTGTGTLTFNMAAGQQYTPTFYVQALAGSGTATVNISAAGYANGTGTMTLYPSGFALQASDFTTHLSDNPTTLTVVPAALDPTFLNVYAVQQLRPNQPNTKATLALTDQSGTSPVGTITLNPVTFQGDDTPNSQTTSFQPLHAGSTLIKITSPSGFSNASSQVTATVVP